MIQVIPSVILSNVTLLNNLLLNSYFKNLTVRLLVLYILNMHDSFHVNRMLSLLFTIRSINSSFIHYLKSQKIEFKQLINGIVIYFLSS